MPLRFVAFFTVLTTIVFAIHGYLGWRLVGPSGLTGLPRALAWGAVFGFALLLPIGFGARFLVRGPAADVVSWIGFTAMALFSFVLTFTVLRDLGWLIAKASSTLPADPVRRQSILHLTNLVLLGGSTALTALGGLAARRRAAVVDVVVPITDLPAALEGFTIVQITDIHVGPTIKKGYIEAIVDGVNALDADLVAVTGDVVDGSVLELSEHTAPLGNLKGKHGVFFCTGNHEYYSGANEWCAELTRLGLRPLMNDHVVVNHEGEDVVVAGVTDFNAGTIIPEHASDPQKAIDNAPSSSKLKILLAHQPRSCFAAVDCGFHLQLSGHTHGGQFFPWIFMVRLQQPFNAGLARMKDLWVYTSRGTGYWGPPVRVGAPSEITRLRMTRAV
jgi:predicted MPP superfamily phosphohydrolase